MDDDQLIIFDGRQSEVAAAVQRGVCRMLRHAGFASLTELPLASGRRSDVIGINSKGLIWIIEIKSCLADFRSDSKWHEYWEYCDALYFAVPADFPHNVLPSEAGLIVADAWGAEILSSPAERKLAGGRRKAVSMRFARAAALRLQAVHDPKFTERN